MAITIKITLDPDVYTDLSVTEAERDRPFVQDPPTRVVVGFDVPGIEEVGADIIEDEVRRIFGPLAQDYDAEIAYVSVSA